MYNQYFGLNENPFSIAPNPRFLFMSKRHKEALAHLLYGVSEGGGFVMLTGEVGTGKTTICRCLLEQLPDNCELAFVLNPKLTALELLATICDDLQIQYDKTGVSVKQLMDNLSRHLIAKHQEGMRVVLMIDEAQNLSAEVLEQVRLLTNLETNTEKLLQIILIGQPELKTLLNRRVLRQLAQRVTARYHLDPLSEEETDDYITHRLAIAGQRHNPFNEAGIRFLHNISGGIPRLINTICDRALLGAYVLNKKVIDAKVIRKAAKEVMGDQAKELASVDKSDTADQAAMRFEGGGIFISKPAFFAGLGTVVSLFIAVFVWQSGILVGLDSQATSSSTQKMDEQLVAAAKTGALDMRDEAPPVEALSTHVSDESIDQTVATNQGLPHDDADKVLSEQELIAAIWTEQTWQRDNSEAHKFLFAKWRVDYNPYEHGGPCRFALTQGLKCEANYGSWRDLLSMNRPALLKFMTKDRGHFYGVLVSISNSDDGVYGEFQFGEQQSRFKLDQLNSLWTGSYTLLWRLPPGYRKPVGRGSKGKVVTWLSEKLAAIAGASTYEALTEYNGSLAKRIKLFQRQNNLIPDGIAGAQTMIFVNSYVEESVPRLYLGEQPKLLAEQRQ